MIGEAGDGEEAVNRVLVLEAQFLSGLRVVVEDDAPYMRCCDGGSVTLVSNHYSCTRCHRDISFEEFDATSRRYFDGLRPRP